MPQVTEFRLRQFKTDPSKTIPYWIEFLDISEKKDVLSVKTRDLYSYHTLLHRVNTHIEIIFELEDEPETFKIEANEKSLKIIFKGNIRDCLDLLEEQSAFSPEAYEQSLEILNMPEKINTLTDRNKSIDTENEFQCKIILQPTDTDIPSTTKQISLSQLGPTLFKSDNNSKTPPTPSSENKSSYSI